MSNIWHELEVSMKKTRLYSITVIIVLFLLGILSVFATGQGWHSITAGLIFVALAGVVSLVLVLARHLKWSVLSAERRLQTDLKQIQSELKSERKLLTSLRSDLRRLHDTQNDDLVVVEAHIQNLGTRVQRVLDMYKERREVFPEDIREQN